jgi:hypothetical protein
LFGFEHLLLALEQGKKQNDGPCLLQILRALDTKAGYTRSTMTDEAPVLDVGDLVIVRDDDEFSVVTGLCGSVVPFPQVAHPQVH